jgi:enoyl-CoA hydratase
MDAAMELAETVCKNGPFAVRKAKEIAVRALHQTEGFVLEREIGMQVLASEDAKEGPQAFLEKRPPRFKGS